MPRYSPDEVPMLRSRRELLIELAGREAKRQFGSAYAWIAEAGVSRGTWRQIEKRISLPMEKTARQLVEVLDAITWSDFNKRLERRGGEEIGGVAGRALPACIVPISVSGALISWAATYNEIGTSDLYDGRETGPPLRCHVRMRPAKAIRENLEFHQAPDGAVERALTRAPLTYLFRSAALEIQRLARQGNKNAEILTIKGFRMWHDCTTGLAWCDPKEPFVKTDRSLFHRTQGEQGEEAAAEALFGKLNGKTILVEQGEMERRIDCWESGLKKKIDGAPKKIFDRVTVSSSSQAFELLRKRALHKDYVVAVSNLQIWALRRDEVSFISLLISDEEGRPESFQPEHADPERQKADRDKCRIIAVRKGVLDEGEMDVTARWFVELSRRLRRTYQEMFKFYNGPVAEELEYHGAPGMEFNKTSLRAMIADGLLLGLPSETEHPQFAPLDDDLDDLGEKPKESAC